MGFLNYGWIGGVRLLVDSFFFFSSSVGGEWGVWVSFFFSLFHHVRYWEFGSR